MKIEVLLSCMYQKDISIVAQSHLQQVPTVVINQCDVSAEQTRYPTPQLTWVDTPTRGLSISRNLAIRNASADVCVLSDNDEVFKEDLVKVVAQGYAQFPQADVIVFGHPVYGGRKQGNKARKLGKYELLRVSSVQISFRLSCVKDNIFFDSLLGAGTDNGGGEEIKFLLDCYYKGLQIYYVPFVLSKLISQPSTWFLGYDEKYFYNRGRSTRYIFGFSFACLYGVYFLVTKYKRYVQSVPVSKASRALWKGIVQGMEHPQCI